MQGRVLGFNAGENEGAISADDGTRYKFSREQWKGEGEPEAGAKVDFMADGESAKDIYPVKSTITGPDLSALASNPNVGWALAKPHVIGAGLALIGFLIAGHLLVVFDVFDFLGAMGDLQRVGGGAWMIICFSLAAISMLGFYIVAATSGWLIYRALSNSESPRTVFYAGVAAVALPIVIPILVRLFIWMGLPSMIRRAARGADWGGGMSGLAIFGAILMIAGGVLILAQRFGYVKKIELPKS